jgi:hypothetical protein
LPGDFKPGTSALDGQFTLHLGKARHDMEEEAPGRRAGVDSTRRSGIPARHWAVEDAASPGEGQKAKKQ